MIPTLLFLKYLLFMELGNPAVDYQTEHCYAMKSGSNLSFGNRVCSLQEPSDTEVDQIINFMGTTPFRWFVAESDNAVIEQLQKKGLHQVTEHPAMIINVEEVKPQVYPAGVEIKFVSTDEDLRSWNSIVASGFEMPSEFAKFTDYILKRAFPGTVKLYLAYYNGIPVATSMTIQRGNLISVHWIVTLEAYRGKGIGAAVSHKPLLDAKSNGCTQAILLATEMGKSVYDKIGYKTYANYKVFSR